jgi:CxxC motif-containing protein (DUF1111 family)
LAVRLVTDYVLGLPPPRPGGGADPQVAPGEAVFARLGCAACHRPELPVASATGGPSTIRPYTDLLLHDLGAGLADGLAEWQAEGGEWRTPPLWGLGQAAAAGRGGLLHDGRARTLMEAILWHGGEAQASRDGTIALGSSQRANLLRFLESL